MERSIGVADEAIAIVKESFERAKANKKLPDDFELNDQNMLAFLTAQTLENLGQDFAEVSFGQIRAMETGLRVAYEIGRQSEEGEVIK